MTKPHDDIQAATEAIEQGNMIYNGHLYSVVCNEYLSALKAQQQAPDLDIICNPRMWSADMSEAWHAHIPDTQKAFESLKQALLKGKDDD